MTKLTILSREAIFNSGKYSGLSVNHVLSTLKDANYIRWSYYNLKNLSFSDNILKLLQIAKINKPGTNRKFNQPAKKKKINKSHEYKKSNKISKGKLQAFNHGKVNNPF